jgi:hypothetical protein
LLGIHPAERKKRNQRRLRTGVHISSRVRFFFLSHLQSVGSGTDKDRSVISEKAEKCSNSRWKSDASLFADRKAWMQPAIDPESGLQEFPKTVICVDGRVIRLSILRPNPSLTEHPRLIRRVCVPSSIESISASPFENLRTLSNVAFESGSRLSNLGEGAFLYCYSLQSICIPSRIRTISELCFSGCQNLASLRFERGSVISEICSWALQGCTSLQSLFVPASLREITGLAMSGCGIECVIVDGENRFFKALDDFLVDFDNRCLVRYYGNERDVTISSDIARLSAGCFSGCDRLLSVTFAPGSRVSNLPDYLFIFCTSLRSICIPSSVETISQSCFRFCASLSDVTFEPGSKLSSVHYSAFENCFSLRSTSIPSPSATIWP